jgi:hypothetical protein
MYRIPLVGLISDRFVSGCTRDRLADDVKPASRAAHKVIRQYHIIVSGSICDAVFFWRCNYEGWMIRSTGRYTRLTVHCCRIRSSTTSLLRSEIFHFVVTVVST